MITMPNSYKQSMNRSFRNRSLMFVAIGVINQEAQGNARVDPSIKYSYLSNLKKPFEDVSPTKRYSSFETKGFKADGTQYYPPRKVGNMIFNQGILTESVNEKVIILLDKEYSIRGLNINFGVNYPTEFEINYKNENGVVTKEVYKNNNQSWSIDEIHIFKSIEIVPIKFESNGKNRLRIENIKMGTGISFENNKIISSNNKEYVSSIVESLPAVDFNLKAENYDRQFDVENVNSPINYLEVGQSVTVKYGYEIEPGNILWIDGGVFNLTNWEADDTSLSITAKDKIEALDDTFYGGKVGSISAYDLAIEVLTDAGVKDHNYRLDDYLKEVIINNPMPCVTHREALQLIANACRCSLRVDRQGIIIISPAFITVASPDRMNVTSDNATEYSNLKSIIDTSKQNNYATYSRGQFLANGEFLYLPKNNSYLNTGYVSKEVSDSKGKFTNNPKIRVKLEGTSTYYSIGIDFASNPPKKGVIRTFDNGIKKKEVILVDLDYKNEITDYFLNFDEIEFEFTEGVPDSRIFVSKVRFGSISDYRLSYGLMLKSPKGIQEEKTSRVEVLRHTYINGNTSSVIFEENVDLTNISEYTVYFSEAVHNVEALADDVPLNIIKSSAYYATMDVSKVTGIRKVKVQGIAYIVTDKIVSKTLDSRGKIEKFDNPLISTDEQAALQVDWISNYYANNVEYDIAYRGEPRVESMDIVTVENKYVEDLSIQIYEHTISFNGALRGSMKARRIKREGV